MTVDATMPAGALADAVRAWIAEGHSIYTELSPTDARYVARLLGGEITSGVVSVDRADRLLIALGLEGTLHELAPAPAREGRSGYTWPNPHPSRLLTTEQVKAAHVLYVREELSLRALGELLWERFGYSNAKSCANALHDAFKRHGLPRRDRIAATVKASTTHGRGARNDKAAYKRWHRATFGAWPSDLKDYATAEASS